MKFKLFSTHMSGFRKEISSLKRGEDVRYIHFLLFSLISCAFLASLICTSSLSHNTFFHLITKIIIYGHNTVARNEEEAHYPLLN
jgi:hypothetical protein